MTFTRPGIFALLAVFACLNACSSAYVPLPDIAPSATPFSEPTPWPERPLPTMTQYAQHDIEQDTSKDYPETCPSGDSSCKPRAALAMAMKCQQIDGDGKATQDQLHPGSSFGAGLIPRDPIAVCNYLDESGAAAPGNAIFSKSLSWPVTRHYATWYLARTSEGVVKLSNEADFRRHFAPVEAATEALAFVLALKEDTHKLEQSYIEQLSADRTRFVAETATETHVQADGEDWKVLNVLRHASCGQLIERVELSAVPGYAVDYRVGRDGTITEIGKRLIFVNVNCPFE